MPNDTSLPDYAPLLTAYHKAFATELKAMVGSLPIRPGSRILEMACGDGAYTPWLAELAGSSGEVIGFDLSVAYLQQAQELASRADQGAPTRFVAGSIDRMPFAIDSFDVVWCAQSLFSLPDPLGSIERMGKVVKPGGLVAVLEDDTMHQVLLPWPVELELAVRNAEWLALTEEFTSPRKFYVGRRLIHVFREAGLVDLHINTYATDRVAPLDENLHKFLGQYLGELRDRVAPRLEESFRQQLDRLVSPGSPDNMIEQTDFAVTVIDHVVYGRKPEF